MAYPNIDLWSALADGKIVETGDDKWPLFVVDAGLVDVPSGKLLICDPFTIDEALSLTIDVPPGRYPVKVTIADVSDAEETGHFREAYISMIIDPKAEEVERRIITPLFNGAVAEPELDEKDEFCGFGVDAAIACFVDAESFPKCMPEDWYDLVNDDDDPKSWFARLDDADHIREDIANVPLINAKAGENIVLVHTGWGDGYFPIVGGYDQDGRLVRVHVDFIVVAPEYEDEE
jgi:hypothetical protein